MSSKRKIWAVRASTSNTKDMETYLAYNDGFLREEIRVIKILVE